MSCKPALSARAETFSGNKQVSGPQNAFDETPESVSEEQRQISSELMQSMQEKIQEALEADRVKVTDTYGDGRHVSIDVVSKLFEGQSTMKRWDRTCSGDVTTSCWHSNRLSFIRVHIPCDLSDSRISAPFIGAILLPSSLKLILIS